MTFEEYNKFLRNFQEQLTKYLEPVISFQNQVEHIVEPLTSIQQQMAKSLIPIITSQTKLTEVLLEQSVNELSNKLSILSPEILDVFKKQQNIFEKIASSNFYLMSKNISETASNSIREISLNAISELDNFNYPEDLNNTKNTVVEYSIQKSSLNLKQVMEIISFIFMIITSILNLMPNKQLTNIEKRLTNIENALQQIIEIETNEFNLLNEKFD